MTALDNLKTRVQEAVVTGQPLFIAGNGTKAFLRPKAETEGLVVDVTCHQGIIDYRPDELMVRARCGTSLADLRDVLAAEGQMLGFDPPDFGKASSLGGCIAAGLSGSRRPYAGALKDFVLGVGMLLQGGEYCEFGGQVMKNVAGYDVSRLVCGAQGVLGIVADVSLKVLPAPEAEVTRALELDADAAMTKLRILSRKFSVISGSCYQEGQLKVRLSGSAVAVRQAVLEVGGEEAANTFWEDLDTLSLPAFRSAKDIWRLSAPAAEPQVGSCDLMDWGFTQRWLVDPDHDPRADYSGRGHWTRFRFADDVFEAPPFHPLNELEMRIHRRVKSAFDTAGVFNPGRMYMEL